jgi:hypothetical protein
MQLESKLQDLRTWVGNTGIILKSKGCDNETDVNSLSHSLQQYEVNSLPILKHVLFIL